jgi:inner membrane protein
MAACIASVVPDLDSLGFAAGIPYSAPLGHRGFTHSLLFALLLSMLSMAFAAWLGAPAWTVFMVILVSTASHGILDAMTTGGMGVAFFSPLSNTRYFLPWRVILVSPIGVTRFVSSRGVAVLKSELLWVWLPCVSVAVLGLLLRRVFRIS